MFKISQYHSILNASQFTIISKVHGVCCAWCQHLPEIAAALKTVHELRQNDKERTFMKVY